MAAVEPNWPMALMLALTWLVGCSGLLFVAGHLPIRSAPQAVQTGGGPVLVWLDAVVMAGVALATALLAFDSLRWTTIVVLGGFVFLFAPFFVQDLPDAVAETKTGLLLALGIGIAALGAIYAMTGG